MTQQKALFLSEVNGNYEVKERVIPTPGPGELLVKIHSTALNPVDWFASKVPLPFIAQYPTVLGVDSAGTVEAIGEGVDNFMIGEKVFHQGRFINDQATFQQYTIAPADLTAKLPANVSFDEAASISLALSTAAFSLFAGRPQGVPSYIPPWSGGLGKYSGEPIVVFGGATSVGQYGFQLAKLAGFSPIITTASMRHAPFLKAIGATHVVDRYSDVRKEIANILHETGAPSPGMVFCAASEDDVLAAALDVVAPGGQVATVLPVIPPEKYKHTGKHVFGVLRSEYLNKNRDEAVMMVSKLTEWLECGELKPNRVEILPDGLRGIIDGLKRWEENTVSGVKLIGRPQE